LKPSDRDPILFLEDINISMKKSYIFSFVFLVLVLLAIAFSFDSSNLDVPGWHTTIFPPYFIEVIISILFLLFVSIGYWLFSNSADKISWILFALHCTLTIPIVFFIFFPSVFLDIQQGDQEKIIKAVIFRMKLIPFAWAVFIIGQVLCIIYFIRVFRNRRVST
jgi:hypothetical protein